MWRIAAPMILSSVTTPLLGLVDTAVVGHLDKPWYLGAVATGATIFTVLFMGLNFLRMGTTGVTAQAFGRTLPGEDGDEIRHALGRALATALLMALVLILLQPLIIRQGLILLGPGTEVSGYAREYFDIRIWSAPATLANFVIVGWLLGMQNATGPLMLTLATNITNIVLSLVLVLELGMKVRGVAWATLLAEWTGLLVGLVHVRRELAGYSGHWHLEKLLDLGPYRRLLAINADLFLRTMALMFVFAFITAQGARAGDVILAANALLMNFQFFLSYALDGIAHAAEALVGKAVGSRSLAGLLDALRRTRAWSVGFAGLFTLVYLLGGQALIDLLTGMAEVRSTALAYLPWLIALPLISVWSFLYDGVFVGATRSREMRLVMTLSAALVFLPAWYLARPLGNHALWLAFTLFMAVRGLGMHMLLRRMMARGALVSA